MGRYQISYNNESLSLMSKTAPQTVIAGLTRNLPIERDSSSRLGDGGSLSAMTAKALVFSFLVSQSIIHV